MFGGLKDLSILITEIQYHGHLVAQNLNDTVPQRHCEIIWPDTGCFSEVAYSQSTGQKEQLSRCLQRGKSVPFGFLHTPVLSCCCSSLFNMFLVLSKMVEAFGAGSKA